MPPRVTVTMRPLSLHPLSLLTFSLLLLTLLVPPANTRYLRSVSRQQVPSPTLTPTPSAPPFQPSPESPPESSDRPPPLTSPSASPSQPIAPSAQLTPTPPIASFASSPALGNPSSTSTPDASISLTVSPEPLETERETQSPSSSSPVSPTPSQIPVSLSPNSRSPSAQPSISSSPLPSSSVEATSLPDSNSPTVSLSPSSRAKRKTRVTPSLQTTPSPSILPSPFPSPTLNLDDSSEQPSPLVSQAENQTSQSTSPDQSPPNLPTASPSPAQSTAQPFSPSNSANDTVDVEISGGPSGEATDDTDTEGGSGANVTGSSSEDQQADTTRPTSEPSPSSSSQSSPSASLTLPPSPESDPPNVIPSPEVTASFSDGALSSPTVPDIILESEMPSEEPSPTITPVGADIIASASSLSASPSSLPVETEIAEGIQSFTITPEPSLVAPRLPSNDSSFSSESPQPSAASGGLSPLLSSLITASPSNIPVVSVSVSEEVVPMLAETVIPRESRSVESSQVILPSAEVEMSISQSSTPATSEQGISTQDNVDVTPESSQIAAVSSSAGVVPSARGPSPSLILEGEVSAENETEATPQVFVSLAPSPSTDSASVGSESMLPLPTEQEETLEVSVTPTTESSTTDMMTPFPSLSPSQSEALRPSPVGQEELISESASPIMSNSPFDVTPSFATIMPSLIEPVVSVPIDFEEASEASMAPLPTMSPPPPLESPREASQVPSEPSFTVSVEQEDAVAASVVPDPEASAPSITSPQATLSASYSASLSPAEVGLIDAENPVDGGEIETPEITPSMTLSPTVEATAGNEPTDVLTTGQGISEENFMTPTPSALEFAAVSQEASQADTELTAIPVIDEGEVEGEDESTQSPETSNSVTASSSATPSAAIVGTQPISTFELDEQASAPSVASPTAEMSFEGIPIPSAAIEQDELVRNTIMPMPSVSAAMRSPGVQTLASEGTLAPSLPTEQLFEGGSLQPTAEISVPIVSPSSLRPSPGMSEGAASALSEQGESTEEGTTPVPITSESEVFESSAIITPSRSPMITVAIEQEDMTMVSADPSLEMSPSSSTDSLPFTSQGVDEPLATDTAESSDPLPSGSARPPQITSDDGNSSGNSITSATETITTPEASFMGHASQSVDEPLASSVALEDNELEEDMAPSESSSLPFSSISPNAIEISSMPVTISPEPSHTESSTASRDATPSPAPQTENISVPTPEVVQMTLTASQPPEISDSAPVGIPIATMSITDGEVFEAISPSSGPSEEQPNPTVDDEVDVSTSAEPSLSGVGIPSLLPSSEANDEQEISPTSSTLAVEENSGASPQGFSEQTTASEDIGAVLHTSSLSPTAEDPRPGEDELSASSAPSLENILPTPVSEVSLPISPPFSESVPSAMAGEPSPFSTSPVASDLPSPAPESEIFSIASPSADQQEVDRSPEPYSTTSPGLIQSPEIGMSPLEDISSPTESPHQKEDSFADEADSTSAPLSEMASPSMDFLPSPPSSSILAEESVAASEEAVTTTDGPAATRTPLPEISFSPRAVETPEENGPLPSVLPTNQNFPPEESPHVSQTGVPQASTPEQQQSNMDFPPGISMQSQITQTVHPDDGVGVFDEDVVLPSNTPLIGIGLPESEGPQFSESAALPEEESQSDTPEGMSSGQISPEMSESPGTESPSSEQKLPAEFSAEASLDVTQSGESSPTSDASIDDTSGGDSPVVPESENERPFASPIVAAESSSSSEPPLRNETQGGFGVSEEELLSPTPLEPGVATFEASPASIASEGPSPIGTVVPPNPDGSPLGSLEPSGIAPDRVGEQGAQPSSLASGEAENVGFESPLASPYQGPLEPSLALAGPPEVSSGPVLTQESSSSELGSESEGIPTSEGSEASPLASASIGAISFGDMETAEATIFESPSPGESGSGLSPSFSPPGGVVTPSLTAEAIESSQAMELDGGKQEESEVETPAADEGLIPTQELIEASSVPVAATSPDRLPFQTSEPLPSVQGTEEMTSTSENVPDVNSEVGLPSPSSETITSAISSPDQSPLSTPLNSDDMDQNTITVDPSSPLDGPFVDPPGEDLTSPFASSSPDDVSSVAESPNPSTPEMVPSLLPTISPSLTSSNSEETEPLPSVDFESDATNVLASTAPETVLGDPNDVNPETSPDFREASPSMNPSDNSDASASNPNEGTTVDIQPSEATLVPSPETDSASATQSLEEGNSPLLLTSSPEFSSSAPTPDSSSMSGGTFVSSSPQVEEILPSPTPRVPSDTSLEPNVEVSSPPASVFQEESPSVNVGNSLSEIDDTGSPQPVESVPDESILATPSHSPAVAAAGNQGDANLLSSEPPDEDLNGGGPSLSPDPGALEGVGASNLPGSVSGDPADTGVSPSEGFASEESEDLDVSQLPAEPSGFVEGTPVPQLPETSSDDSVPAISPELSEASPDVVESVAVPQSSENVSESFEDAEVSASIGAIPELTADGGELDLPRATPEESSDVGASQTPLLLTASEEALEPGNVAEESGAAQLSLDPETSIGESEVSIAPSLPPFFPENSLAPDETTETDGIGPFGSQEVTQEGPDGEEILPSQDEIPVESDAVEEPQPSGLTPELSEEADVPFSTGEQPQISATITPSPSSEQQPEEPSDVQSTGTEAEESMAAEAMPSVEVLPQETSDIPSASPTPVAILGESPLPSLEGFPEESDDNMLRPSQVSPEGPEGSDDFQPSDELPDPSNNGTEETSSEASAEGSFSPAPDEIPSESIEADIPLQISPSEIESVSNSPSPASTSLDDDSGSPSTVGNSPELISSTLAPTDESGFPTSPPSNGGLGSPEASEGPTVTQAVEPAQQTVSSSPSMASVTVTGPIDVSVSISPSLSPSLSGSPGPERAFPPGTGSGATPGLGSLANSDAPQGGGTDPDPSQSSGLPGGVGGVSGIAIGAFLVVAIVGSVVYKSCAVFPGSVGFGITSIFGSSDDGDDGNGSARYDGLGDDSPWDQVWRSASELPERVVAAGEAAAALVGGEFAGLFKPGAARVRPPQVITRLAVPGMCMALSQLSPGSVGSEVFSSVSGHSSESKSFRSSRFPSSQVNAEVRRGVDGGDREKKKVAGSSSCPKVDLLFVFDASGSLSWRDYRSLKEVLTKPGGLIDTVIRRAGSGSRIGFIEYAYDSVVVSELDRDEESVRRRILSSFQGDANNWDRNGMYIYEVGEDVGGNALRKVDSLVLRDNEDDMKDEEFVEGGSGDIEEPPTVQAKEVPPAMNGMSREAHLALKWCRFEMLPPVANRRIQEQLQNALRLRRVVVVNAGELTKGGQSDMGLEAALEEKREMEKLGIRILTVGIGEEQDKNLGKLATGKSHVSAGSVEGAEQLVKRLGDMILKMNAKYDGKISRNPPAIVKRKWKKRERSAKEKRQQAVYRAVQAGAIDPAKSISKGLPRRASELPPWFTQ